MYNIFKSVIENQPYNLTSMLAKINANWVQSYISDSEREELTALAVEHAQDENDYAPLQAQIDSLFERVAALEQSGAPAAAPETIPDFVQPTNATEAYHYGDKVMWRGQAYICIREGKNVMHDPVTYPIGWKLLSEWEKEQQEG